MKKAGIMIDSWKLPIFKKHLDAAGFEYTECNGLTKDTLLLSVMFDDLDKLRPVVEAAHKECDRAKQKH